MNRCIQLAGLGSGFTAPNPLVGSVIVSKGKIIGEGYHERFGGPHAEVNAIRSVSDENLLNDSTLYVNLEPCSHFGKTPPCVNLIIEKKIPRVVIGMQDPFEQVRGNGIRLLREAGIEVITGIAEKECRMLNRRFIVFHEFKRPYIVLKWAKSANGIIGKKSERIMISNDLSQRYTHSWRSEEKGIMAGAGTILADNPRLDTRFSGGPSPVRIIADRSGSLQGMQSLNVFDGSQRTLVFTSNHEANYTNAEVFRIGESGSFLHECLNILHQLGIMSVMVEGGSTLLKLFLKEGLWDECRIFDSGKIIQGDIVSPPVPDGITSTCQIKDNLLIEIINSGSIWI